MKIFEYIEKWEQIYKNGLPDEVPNRLEHLNKAPSYKQLVKCFLKNDLNLKGLGYAQKKSKVYNQIKRNELKKRGDILEIDLL